MEDEREERSGPDLEVGVAISELVEGEPCLGHAGGDAVVLVRRGEELFAVGAVCTHYGGPLAEGLVVGETIRCPWHHACFSLRTGEALGAPALNPVARWRVEVQDGLARVRERTEAEPLASLGRRAEGPASVVIVGAGAAGSAAAEMLRREGYEGPISLVDPDAAAPYDRPNLSKDYLAGNASEEWIPLRPEGFYADHGIDRVVAAVESVDLQSRSVRLSDGRSLDFGALLLATGARPVRLTVPGGDLEHVRVLRSLADCREIIARAGDARRVVVLGASFIGMEAAAALRARGLEVTVVAPGAIPFERSLGSELGGVLRGAHEAHGVRFSLGHRAQAITRDAVRLDDGTALAADLVVVGIGVRPDTKVAEEAGLPVDDGVLVSAFLETSTPGVFAAGDIARYPDARTGRPARVEHWVVAQRQGQTAARNILGHHEAFTDPPFFWTRQWEVGIRYVGHARKWDGIRIEGDPRAGDAAVHYLSDGGPVAVATLGRDLESLHIEAAMELATAGPSPTGTPELP